MKNRSNKGGRKEKKEKYWQNLDIHICHPMRPARLVCFIATLLLAEQDDSHFPSTENMVLFWITTSPITCVFPYSLSMSPLIFCPFTLLFYSLFSFYSRPLFKSDISCLLLVSVCHLSIMPHHSLCLSLILHYLLFHCLTWFISQHTYFHLSSSYFSNLNRFYISLNLIFWISLIAVWNCINSIFYTESTKTKHKA